MSRRRASVWIGVTACLVGILALTGKVGIWVDADGRTVFSDSEEPPTPGAVEIAPEELASRWRGSWTDPEPPSRVEGGSSTRDPVLRALLEALDDIERGERSRGLRMLRRLHREHPARAEVAWVLADTERRRGRHEAARDVLESALSAGSTMPPDWRERLIALRQQVETDLHHAEQLGAGTLRAEQGRHFRVVYDHPFAGRAYADVLLTSLELIRSRLQSSLGRSLAEPLGVRLYTRAEYLQAYKHRFGFATVGFYDGVIHAVASRRPQPQLLALLTHEYTHALFLDALGSHRPFFMNEGIAEREEDRVQGRTGLVRGEWRKLLDADRDGSWIPLERLVRDFAGLDGDRALLAYLESRAAIETIEAGFPGAVPRWLDRCAAGEPWEDALIAETGWHVGARDAAVRREAASRFVPVEVGP